MSTEKGFDTSFALRVAVAVGIAIALVSLLAMLWLALDVLLLVFAGILVAVMLRGLADLLARHSFLRGGWSVLAVVILAISFLAAALWLAATPVVNQFDTLKTTLPQMAEQIQQQLWRYDWGQWLVEQALSIEWMLRRINLFAKMTGAISTAFGAVVNIVVMAFMGLYLAIHPDTYINGLIRLFPVARRQRMREVLQESGRILRWWLTGTLCSMTIIGMISGVGLWLLDIPFALALAVIAGLLSLIPYLGAIVSALPAMVVATTQGPEFALYVAGLYLGIHVIEGYVVSPVIQQYAVSMPPTLMMFAQIMLGILVGGMGVVLAAPIAAVALGAVKMLYVEDVLGDYGKEGPSQGVQER
jgi:predicted PurR-regulated permease PerM